MSDIEKFTVKGNKKDMSSFRLVVLGILFVMWTAFSYGVYTIMTDAGFIGWWQNVIILCFVWLAYVFICRLFQIK